MVNLIATARLSACLRHMAVSKGLSQSGFEKMILDYTYLNPMQLLLHYLNPPKMSYSE